MKNVYLSVVVTSRNDNHDGSLVHRMRLFFSTLYSKLSRCIVPTEILIVEWNPPPDRPSIREVLPVLKKKTSCSVRIVTVPHHVHEEYEHADKIQLFQFIAKNVGIRRAHGSFILATNIDILFSDPILKHVEERKLVENEMLRALRFDVPDMIRESWDRKKILEWCKAHTLRGYFPAGIASKRGFMERMFEYVRQTKPIPNLFTNACGDFTLLSRNYWHAVRGYPELPLHGVKIDGLLCFSAHFAGAKEHILPYDACVYHIDHENSWSSEKGKDLQARLTEKGIPFLSREEYIRNIKIMTWKNRPMVCNDEHWGLARTTLGEYVF